MNQTEDRVFITGEDTDFTRLADGSVVITHGSQFFTIDEETWVSVVLTMTAFNERPGDWIKWIQHHKGEVDALQDPNYPRPISVNQNQTYTILVNGLDCTVDRSSVTFDDIALLDDSKGTSNLCTYHHGPGRNIEGILHQGYSVFVKDGMSFTIVRCS